MSSLPATTVGVADLLAGARAVFASCQEAPGDRERQDWTDVVAGAQEVINALAAVQDAAIARLAAIEVHDQADGTLGEHARGMGHVALDAADIVAPAIAATHAYAEARVHRAVRLAGDGLGLAPSGLRGLHTAMAAGRLDTYRADVVETELTQAPAEVARAVVAALDPHLDTDTAPALRRRVRRLVSSLSPEVLRRRAQRARRESGLRRWAAEPGVDQWVGTFPAEEAATAWAAIDALAQTYRSDGTCDHIDRARAKALTDLVAGNATVTTELWLATASTVHGGGVPQASRPATSSTTTSPARRALPAPADSLVGALPADKTADALPADKAADALPADDLVGVRLGRGLEPMLAPRAWISAMTPQGTLVCDPGTGAATTFTRPAVASSPAAGSNHQRPPSPTAGGPTPSRYRPPAAMARLVRLRDGTCRFPGCGVSARFCDLDHVRPWPSGPTTPSNLMCLCRRHHRIKQLPGWLVALRSDGTVLWRDPHGRERLTEPVDHLHAGTLPAPADQSPSPSLPAPAESSTEPRPVDDAHQRAPFSHGEFRLEHLVAGISGLGGARPFSRPPRTRCDLVVPTIRVRCDRAPARGPRARQTPPDDEPPF